MFFELGPWVCYWLGFQTAIVPSGLVLLWMMWRAPDHRLAIETVDVGRTLSCVASTQTFASNGTLLVDPCNAW
jgi:hypothetical protein